MENSNNINKLIAILKKVNQLKGFGDMDSYSLVREFKNLVHAPNDELDGIIQDMASPQTWNFAKSMFIENVENFIQNIASEQMVELA